MRITAIVFILTCCAAIGVAGAQDTREETLTRQRAEKARALHPYQSGKVESALIYIEHSRLIERLLASPSGFYPRLGMAGQTTGSGFAVGPGYRTRFLRDQGLFQIGGAMSLRGYRLADATLMFPRLADNRLVLGAVARYRRFPQEDFYGLGPDSRKSERVNFLMKDVDYIGTAAVRPAAWLLAGTRIGLLNSVDVGHGTDIRFASIEERFNEATAPGLAAQPAFLHNDVFVDADYRDQPGNARSGGRYQVTWTRYSDRDLDRYSFRRLDGQVEQFFPIFDKKRVIAVRGRVIASDTDAGQTVPFYMRPTIGGNTTVRGFSDFRFRDQSLLLLNAEYRWEAFSGLDMALFYDAGKVASRRADLDFSDLKRAYGLGFRFNTYRSVFLRLDVGRSGADGTHIFVKFSPVF